MTQPIPAGMTPDTLLQLHTAVADWYIRRQQSGWTAADERAMNAWLGADPLRGEIMESMNRTWQQAGQLKQFRPETYGHAGARTPAATPAHKPVRAADAGAGMAVPWTRRRFVAPALAAACAALVVAGWYQWDGTPSYRLDLATGPGDIRTVDLPDGTQIALNVGSTLQVRYYPRRREVVLNQGEAFFRVAPDAAKPFTVDSGASQVRVVGTAFNVRAAPPQLVVNVLEGKVEVRADRGAPNDPVLQLGAGAGVGIDPSTGQHQSLRTTPEAVGEWRTGQIHFSRTPLAEVAQELARYLGEPVAVEGADVQALRISGFLAVRAPENFIQALPDVAPVRVDRDAQGSWRISRR